MKVEVELDLLKALGAYVQNTTASPQAFIAFGRYLQQLGELVAKHEKENKSADDMPSTKR